MNRFYFGIINQSLSCSLSFFIRLRLLQSSYSLIFCSPVGCFQVILQIRCQQMLKAPPFFNLVFSFQQAIFVREDVFFFPQYFLAPFVTFHVFIILSFSNLQFKISIWFILFGIIRLVGLLLRFQEQEEVRVPIMKTSFQLVFLQQLLIFSFFIIADTTFDLVLWLLIIISPIEIQLFMKQPRTLQQPFQFRVFKVTIRQFRYDFDGLSSLNFNNITSFMALWVYLLQGFNLQFLIFGHHYFLKGQKIVAKQNLPKDLRVFFAFNPLNNTFFESFLSNTDFFNHSFQKQSRKSCEFLEDLSVLKLIFLDIFKDNAVFFDKIQKRIFPDGGCQVLTYIIVYPLFILTQFLLFCLLFFLFLQPKYPIKHKICFYNNEPIKSKFTQILHKIYDQ